MKWSLADGQSLDGVLTHLSQGRETYALEAEDDGSYTLVRCDGWQPGQTTLGDYRQTEPLKALFFPAREFIGRWNSAADRPPLAERIVFGVKNCDLSSLAVFDHVFLDGVVKDPYYAEARQKTILVSTDCAGQLDVCFCPAVDEQPYASEGFDINIVETPTGTLLEEGSERGAQLLEAVQARLRPADDELLAAVKAQRERRYRELCEQCEAHGLTPGTDLRAAVEGAFQSPLWGDFAADCVECGACNFICCTCHCFLLADGVDRSGAPARTRLWDACLYAGFARTAGGGTPRPFRAERLRNRFDKKFSYFPQVLGRYACDGCGRCTQACIADIDVRKVLKRAMDESSALHADTGSDRRD